MFLARYHATRDDVEVEGHMSLKPMASKGLVLSIAVTMIVGAQVRAQSPRGLREGDLASITGLTCTFPIATVVVWNNGVPEPRVSTDDVFNVEFDKIDTVDNIAVIRSSAGLESVVTVQAYGWNMHFLEVSQNGRMRITTVFAQYATGEKLKAVHTMTDYLPINVPGVISQPRLTQSYGSCESKR